MDTVNLAVRIQNNLTIREGGRKKVDGGLEVVPKNKTRKNCQEIRKGQQSTPHYQSLLSI